MAKKSRSRVVAEKSVEPTKKVDAEQSYLQRIEFDPLLLGSVVAKYINNFRLVALLILTILLLGTVSFFNLPRRLNPEVNIPIVSIVTVLPGASPEDVESLVTIPLENEVRSAEGIDTVTSVSNENVSVITMQFFSQVNPDEAKDEVQSLVDGVTDLPEDAQRPQVSALDFEDQPIWTFAITTEGDPRTLMTFAKELQTAIEELPRVDRVETSGYETQEIVITLDQQKVRQYGFNPLLISQTIQRSVGSFPAGNVETDSNAFSLTINPSITTLEDLRQLKLSVQGQVVSLSDIATVAERPKLNQQEAFLAEPGKEPQRAVTFYVYKITSVSIDQAGEQVKEEVESVLARYNDKYKLTSISNTSELISEQFSDLLGEFRATILLVFACLLIFLGLRQAIISSLTVPLTFLSAFVVMNAIGMSINFLSLFSFLLALGLIVDDTIVVVSAMTTYYRTGRFNPLQTGLLVWKDTIVPIWSTTITTIWSFVPLLLTTGIIGEFIKPIPIVVTATMVSSTAIAALITLPIMMVILKPNFPGRIWLLLKILGVIASLGLVIFFVMGNPLLPIIAVLYLVMLAVVAISFKTLKTRAKAFMSNNKTARGLQSRLSRISNHGIINIEGFANWYYRLIYGIISKTSSRRKVIFAIVLYALVGFILLPMGLVKNEFFPKTDGESVYVNLELPAGTTSTITQTETRRLLGELVHMPKVQFVTAEVGRGVSTGFGGGGTSSNRSSFTLYLGKPEERDEASFEIAEQIREKYKDYTTGTLSVVEESGGPPAGADVQIELLGENLDTLNGYADEVAKYLEEQPGLVNVEKSYKTGTTQLVFVPDQTKLAQAGIGVEQLGLYLRMFASGFTLDKVDFAGNRDEEQDVVFRFTEETADPISLSSVVIPTQTGAAYPLLSLGSVETRANPTSINRKDGSRSITITAATQPGVNSAQENQKLLSFVEGMNFDQGYTWQTGGVNEENQKSINSILQAMLVSAVLILITMVVQFNSFRQAFIVLIVIPLAVSSVFYVFAITGTPLSFPALIGVLSLFGIVVTNSMFIVDKINLNRREGMEFTQAIADSGASRLEPIILTKLSTVLGLLPITLADPLWRGLGGAIISGLLLASSIMLLFIPAVYYTIFQGEKKN